MNDRTIRTRLRKYFAHSPYPVQFAYLFGSHARGQALPFSDIDVGVYLDEPDAARRSEMYAPLLTGMMDALHTEGVDLMYLNDAPPRFAFNIVKGRPIYSVNERARTQAEAHILSRYFDERAASNLYNHYLLNPAKLHKALQTDLGYLVEFSRQISVFLEKQEKKERAKRKKGAKK